MGDLLSVLIFVGGGLFFSLVLRGGFTVFPTAVLISAGLALVSSIVHILIDLPMIAIWWLLVAGGSASLMSVKRTRQRILLNLKARWVMSDILFLGTTVALLAIYSYRIPAPVGWDARSIWFFHASWLTGPAKDYLDGFSLNLIYPDYPILGPGAMALTWGHLGGENLAVGSFVILLLSLAALSLSAYYVQNTFFNSVPLGIRWAVFTLLVMSGATLANGMIATGYQDVLQAAMIGLVVSGLLMRLAGRYEPIDLAMLGVWAFLAVNVKQEGFWFAIVVLFAYFISNLRNLKIFDALPLVGALLGKLSWWAVLEVNGAPDSGSTGGLFGRLPELLDFDSTGWMLIGEVLRQAGLEHFTLLLILLLLTVAGLAILNWKEAGALNASAFFVLSWLGLATLIVLTYALGDPRDSLEWWLATSFYRIVATPDFLIWTSVGWSILHMSSVGSSKARR